MPRIKIFFDECKPHWAKDRYLARLAVMGLTAPIVSGDFDIKEAVISGHVEDFEAFKTLFNADPMAAEGTLREPGSWWVK